MRRSSVCGCIALLCLLATGVFCPAQTPDREAARDLYKQGLRAYRAGKLEQALHRFDLSSRIDPVYPYPVFAQARIHHAIFDQETRGYQEAAAAYERTKEILRAHPPDEKARALYQAFFFSGLLYLKGGDYEKAHRDLRAFQQLDPGFVNREETHNAIGIASYYLDQYDEAVEEFKRALDTEPDFAEARFNLRSVFTRLAVYNEAVAISRAGELDLAMEKLRQLKEFAPRYLPGRSLEGRLYEGLGEMEQALAVYEEILGLDPDHPITYSIRLRLARVHKARGDHRVALDLLEQNLHQFPDIEDERLRREVETLAEELRALL